MRHLHAGLIVSLFVLVATFSTPARSEAASLAIHCPPDLVLLTCSNSAVGNFEVTAEGHDGPVVCVPPSGGEFPLGVTSVLCTATDLNGTSTNCSFSVSVKAPPSRWPCPPPELGLGIPFESVGGAVSVVRPAAGPGSAGISVMLNAVDPESGIVLHPGTGQVMTITTVLDFTAPVGSGFELVLPPDPLHPLDPPILSLRNKGAKGYCVKMNKRFNDDPLTTSRVQVVNSNGAVLPPLEFSPAEIEADGVLEIGFQPGVTNCHVTIELNTLDGGIVVGFAGPVTQSTRRKGWDGCIYGPDRPVKKPHARVMLVPPVTPDAPPITEVRLRASGWPGVVIEEPSITCAREKVFDGHVTLMKAYDDGQAIEFVSLAPQGGPQFDLGPSTAFQMRFSHFEEPASPSPVQAFRIGGGRWPLALTNRPPPPPVEVRLAPGLAGVDCSADYTALGFSNVTVQVWFAGMIQRERTGLPGQLGLPFASFGSWPDLLGCLDVGTLRLGNNGAPLVIFWPDEGSINFGDELRILPELPPGEALPATFSRIECLASEDLQGLFYDLQVTPAPPLDPLAVVCPGDILTSATSPAGAVVNYVPFLHPGECTAFPFPQVVCSPETGGVFPVGTTTVHCSATNGCGEVASCSFDVTVDQRPVILTQPTNLVVTVGESTQLTAVAFSGPPAFYRWEIFCPPTRPDFPFCGCLPAQTWRPLCLGCPPPFVDFPNVTAQCGSGYYLVVSNDFGVVTSAVASLTVVPALQCRDLVFLTCSNSAVGRFDVGVNGQQGEVVCTPPSGTAFPLGTTAVTCVATNYSGGLAECSFSVSVKSTPPGWACAQVGIGLPYEPVGGATVSLRPVTGDGDPAIVVTPQPGQPQSGLRFLPGPAGAVSFTTVLDFTAPVGSGFELVAPPSPLEPNAPPLLSIRSKGAKGYCIKMNKKFSDDAGTALRTYAVNTNGDLLDPITFTSAEVEAEGTFDIGFQPGVTNCHVTIEVDLLTSAVSIGFDGPISPIIPTAFRHKGWDGCIYGPDRPRPKPPKTARVIMVPPVPPGSPPLADLSLYVSGWPQAVVEQPSLTSSGRKWGDGHVTLMKAYDDGTPGVEFRSFAPGGGVQVDLGHSESFRVKLTHFENGDIPDQDQLLTRTIGPIALTNRPSPPPFLDALLLKGPTNAVDCSADFNNLDSPTVRVVLLSNHVVVAQRTGVAGYLDNILFTLPGWPETLSKLAGATPCRRGTIKPGLIKLLGGAGLAADGGDVFVGADEFQVLAELPPGAPHPEFYSGLEFISNDGPTWRVSGLERTLICTPEPLLLSRGPGGITLSWSGVGFKLLGAETVSGPWFDLGVASPVTLGSSHAARYFKLVCD